MPTLVQPVARSSGEIDRGRDVGSAVLAVLQVDRQLGQIDLVAGRTTACTGASSRPTSTNSRLDRAAGARISGSSFGGRDAEGVREPARGSP